MTRELDWFSEPRPVSAEMVRSLQQILQVQLPKEYAEFLRTSSGGAPMQTDFYFVDGARKTTITGAVGIFLSADPSSEDPLIEHWRVLVERGVGGLVPIASTGGGDYICLDYRPGVTAGSVAFWNHGRQGICGEVSAVADSFQAFLAALWEPAAS